MQILTRDTLPLGGFAGLTEHRLVTDSRLFTGRKSPQTFEGLGQFVYLADAKFNPHGETHMHPHKEIDVITIMLDGGVTHEGSLEHGKSLQAGDAQVQRAGGEGFAHNEINPSDKQNRLLQVWALPEESGRPADYKYYQPKAHGMTRIYGGTLEQNDTFDSSTFIDIVRLKAGESMQVSGDSMSYVTQGEVEILEDSQSVTATDGSLVQGKNLAFIIKQDAHLVVISKANA